MKIQFKDGTLTIEGEEQKLPEDGRAVIHCVPENDGPVLEILDREMRVVSSAKVERLFYATAKAQEADVEAPAPKKGAKG
jgi:hypothetical protein